MDTLLLPLLKCKQPVSDVVWTSPVIPAYATRPLCDDDIFVGHQLMAFANPTRHHHVVFDMQVTSGRYFRTGWNTCIADPAGGERVCYGRVNLKDNFLKGKGEFLGHSASLLQLQFFENNICVAVPFFYSGSAKSRDFQIKVDVARGYDKRKDSLSDTYFTLSMLFNEGGKSLTKWMDKVTKATSNV